ncbi:hypothetical protein ACSDQ9_09185 [Aestuariimicrobium soli]|uniref:hypothetical protein n=1 Tax=Aestuariimicrobium soli TaxID=2035834 RepID=UPI003EBF5ABD
MSVSVLIELATLMVAVVGVVGGLIGLQAANRQRRLDLGNLYLQRYWEIDDDLLRLTKGSPEHNQARHRYLRLCEDEFEAAARSWLDPGQWHAWHSWLVTPASRELVRLDLEQCDPERRRFAFLLRCLDSHPGHEWRECGGRTPLVA